MDNKLHVLFVCDGDSARSQMAEGLLRNMADDEFSVSSAGLENNESMHPTSIKCMQEIGIDISAQTAHHINDFEDIQFDYVIALCDQAQKTCLSFPGDKENLHWTCSDPLGVKGTDEDILAAFRVARDEIKHQLETWLEEMK